MDMQSKAKKLIEMIQTTSVEWKPLGEVVPISRGKRLVRSQLQDNGQYPVYQNSLQPLGFYDDQNCRAYMTFVIAAGAAGEIGFSDIEFWAADDCYYFDCPKEILHDKFLYYFLLSERHQLTSQIRKASVPRLGRVSIEKIKIPIPPLETQKKIVKILDKFTELEATLEAELALRKRQYRYYRDFLLDFDNQIGGGIADGYQCRLKDVVWKMLGEVGTLIRGNGLQKKDFTEDGIPAIHYGQIYTQYGNQITETISFVSPELAEKLRKVDKGDVVITNTSENIEDVGKALLYLGERQAVTGGHATIFKPGKEIIGKFFVHFTQTEIFNKAKRKFAKGTKVIDVSATDMAKIKIPIPPLPEQEKIVAILDKFDTLTHSISEGLPHEIVLRRKQYEYYREQLLAFPKAT